ncbi:DNA starvation/stationary phase protection protein [Pseudalgibacter alginicilyticus]|uniref:DNA starvation/stationary phase protection protein n=1 Tax=Pseudalgibacter alginicilyticus TaxID=1736674 RepID=A0A0P0DAP8_9FLAO|nr:DNA starvation/stationary phase protection protein [Pseudalgibacter alginicilyticus]ALJ05123.1 DNA starvation/stationary phase protection protein [Pseudalgibacter alginicilyticus]
MKSNNIGLAKKDLNKSIKNLTEVLSNEMVLYVKLRKFHWNVSGNSFMELHKLFEDQYHAIEKIIDEVAERIGKLGSKSIGTMGEFIEHATLKESTEYEPQDKMLAELLNDHEKIIISIREMVTKMEEDSEDVGTVDFLTALILSHESKAWILRRYIA